MDAAILSEISGTDCHIAGLEKGQKCSGQCNPTTCSHCIELRRNSSFLVLSPVTSQNYSSQQSSPSPRTPSISTSLASAIVEPVKKERRSSSTGSSGAFSKRYLKLGPIHGNGEPGVADYVDIEE